MQEKLLNSKVAVRKFEFSDIPAKVRWINDPEINRYLHYDLPLEIEKTEKWFENVKDREDRYDGIIEVDGEAIGLIGLLDINKDKGEAEYYITLGDKKYGGRGIASIASEKLLGYAFYKLNLKRVILSTEKENAKGNKLYERLGFSKYEPENAKPNLNYFELKKEDYDN